MKVNRRKTEYMCVNERQDNGTVKMQGEEQGITFEKARRATNRSLKMTIWSLGSDLC